MRNRDIDDILLSGEKIVTPESTCVSHEILCLDELLALCMPACSSPCSGYLFLLRKVGNFSVLKWVSLNTFARDSVRLILCSVMSSSPQRLEDRPA